MRILPFIVLFLHLFQHLSGQEKPIRVLNDWSAFENKYLTIDSDTIHVINFWATWCKPCVAELPYFLALDSIYAVQPFKLSLLSLDFAKKQDSILKPFIKKKNIKADVLLFDMGDPNMWIDRIDSSWSGSIPATLIVTKKGNHFFEEEFHSLEELQNIINPFFFNSSKTK